MPRINIDDKLFGDSRFIRLVEFIGNFQTAIGLTVEVMRVGQKYWAEHKLIPVKVFSKIPNADMHLKAGLSHRKVGGIYVAGSDEYFAWLRAKKESSRKGGESLRKKWAIRGPNDSPPALVIAPDRR